MVGLSCLTLTFSQRVVRIKEKEILPCSLAGYVRHDNNQKINSAASGNDNFVRTTLCDEHTTCLFHKKKNSEVKV